MRAALIFAGVLVLLYLLILAALFVFQRRVLFLADNTKPDLERVGIAGLRSLTVTTADGLVLVAWYLPPVREDGLVVLFLHGNAGNIGHRAYRLHPFHQLGWGVFLQEYRGFGGNPGTPTEAGLLADARAGLAALGAMGAPPNRVLVWGESLGSGVAVRLALEQQVAALVLEAPYTSITDVARRRFPFAPVGLLLLDRFDTQRVVGGLRSPVLVIHGGRDGIIPVAMGRAIYDAAPQPKELWISPEAGHVNLVEAGAIEAAGDFVRRLRR